jgi:CRISPR-associated endoribonuclease Cas6
LSRLLIKLVAKEDSHYEMEYHKHIQGLIYGLLRGSEYDSYHNKQGYKFFVFSNIFPFSYVRKNDQRNLIISSPNDNFISHIKQRLESMRDITVGSMKFKAGYCNRLTVKVPPNRASLTLITGTPIIARMQRYRYEEAGMLHLVNNYNPIFWRSNHPVDLFLNQLEDNLIKKYSYYHGIKVAASAATRRRGPLFSRARLLKQVSTKLLTSGGSHKSPVIGTTWKFGFDGSSAVRGLISFALDTGLGELNSLGFGFMNLQVDEDE